MTNTLLTIQGSYKTVSNKREESSVFAFHYFFSLSKRKTNKQKLCPQISKFWIKKFDWG
jgi:hypothetical protein